MMMKTPSPTNIALSSTPLSNRKSPRRRLFHDDEEDNDDDDDGKHRRKKRSVGSSTDYYNNFLKTFLWFQCLLILAFVNRQMQQIHSLHTQQRQSPPRNTVEQDLTSMDLPSSQQENNNNHNNNDMHHLTTSKDTTLVGKNYYIRKSIGSNNSNNKNRNNNDILKENTNSVIETPYQIQIERSTTSQQRRQHSSLPNPSVQEGRQESSIQTIISDTMKAESLTINDSNLSSHAEADIAPAPKSLSDRS